MCGLHVGVVILHVVHASVKSVAVAMATPYSGNLASYTYDRMAMRATSDRHPATSVCVLRFVSQPHAYATTYRDWCSGREGGSTSSPLVTEEIAMGLCICARGRVVLNPFRILFL